MRPADAPVSDGRVADPRRARGRRGELIAELYLRTRGYRVLARRVRTPAAEVDLVCRRGTTLVVVEVKRRLGGRHAATNALTPHQAARLVRASTYLRGRAPWVRSLRVDLVAIDGLRIRHVRDATAGVDERVLRGLR